MSETSADGFEGPVFRPADDGYAEEVATFNLAVSHEPDYVVGATGSGDVVEAVRFATENGLKVAAHCTGHIEAPVTSGVLVSTKRMNSVELDADAALVTADAGVRWGAVIEAAAPHGLAPVAGSSPNVGVVGYLLGGGLGPFARSHGFSSDYVESFEVVTGEGELVRASAEENADLFWALRGGKAGLGIVTQVRVRLAEIPELYAGVLMFETDDIETAFRAWVDWTADADPRVTTSAAHMRLPAFPQVPEPLRGKNLLFVRFAFPGSAEEGQRLAAPLREAAPVYMDMLGPMPLENVAMIHNDPTDPSPGWVRGAMPARVDQDLATVVLKHVGAGVEAPFVGVDLRHVGSAAATDVAEGSAAGGRDAEFVLSFVAVGPDTFAAASVASDALLSDLAPWLSETTNVNFQGHLKSPDDYARGWSPEAWKRLGEVRRTYDPDGVFARG